MTTQNNEALVEALAGIIEGALIRHGVTDFEGTLDDARAILPILHRVRREGIEEAAKVADDLWDRVAGNSERKLHHRMAYRQVAASIRALTEKQP